MSAAGAVAPGPWGPARAHDPPQHLTSFVGRASEQEELLRLLGRVRLLTLTGAGGCGKTRLAARVVARASDRARDGVWWLELAAIDDQAQVVPTLGQMLGVRPLPGQTDLQGVVSHLAPRAGILALDNCEHVLEEVARLVEALARGCPDLQIIATSREPLRAEGETEWRVPPLSLPALDDDVALRPSDAVELFIARAAQVRPQFELSSGTAPVVTRICRDLDGMPLAIELAAARLRALSVQQIAHGLADRLRLLTGGARTALPRQQTLRASIDWSYGLLSDPERALFHRLGVFVDGFVLDAAERVGAGDHVEPEKVLDLLGALVDKSLVQAEERGPAVRFRLLETIREYALERLDEAQETLAVRDRHCEVFLDLAESVEGVVLSPLQPDALRTLDPEAANLQHAIEWAASTEPERALRLCVSLTLWWRLRSRFADADASYLRALGSTAETSVLRARALWGRAFLLTFSGAFEAALSAIPEALAAAEEVDDPAGVARALWLVGTVTMWPDPVGAQPGLERARDLAAASGDDFALMHATQALGMSHSMHDDHETARPFHEDALQLAERLGQRDAQAWHWLAMALAAWVAGDHRTLREAAARALALAVSVGDVVTETGAVFGRCLADLDTGDPRASLGELAEVRERALAGGGFFMVPAADLGKAMALAADGHLEEARGELLALIEGGANGWANVLCRAQVVVAEVRRLLHDPDARVAAEAALDLAERISDRPVLADAQLVLGDLAGARGEWVEAQNLLHQVLPVAAEHGTPRLPRVLEALAAVAHGLESHTEAARLLGAACRLWDDSGLVSWPHRRQEVDRLEASLREALGPEAFAQAVADGRALPADEAVAYVRRARGERKRPASGWESLTPTELQVARHAALGMTNPEIAQAMFISRGTVRTHLSHIFAKVGLKNRAELASEVARRTRSAT